MDSNPVVMVLVVVVVGVGIVYFRYLVAKKRRELFAEVAARQGWSYSPSNDALAGRWSGTPFRKGRNRRCTNVLSGGFNGHQMVAFDYSYQTQSSGSEGGRTTKTHKFGVVVLQLPGALPDLEVTHEGIFGGAAANALGFRDIQFESEQFNRAFRVKADDKWFGRAVLTPQLMELLLARGEIGWRIEGSSLVGWDKGAHNPTAVMNRLSLLQQIVELVPPHIWREYAGVDRRQQAQQPPQNYQDPKGP